MALFAQPVVKIILGIVAALSGVVQCKEIGVAVLSVVDAEAGRSEEHTSELQYRHTSRMPSSA